MKIKGTTLKLSAALLLLQITACNNNEAQNLEPATSDKSYPTAKLYELEEVMGGLSNPWGMAFLPDSSILVTEKSGEMYRIKNGKKQAIADVPEVFFAGQGGLLDLKAHPEYRNNGWLYLTYSSPQGSQPGGHTALMRAQLQNNRLVQKEVLYKASPNVDSRYHFGSRIAFDKQGYVYFSIGERGKREVFPQNIRKDGGKIYRLHADGRIPADNPFVDSVGAKKAIYTYGNRNPQGLATHPQSGEIWEHEHGPRGGDEINIIKKGRNYGWPLVSFGINYDGSILTTDTARKGMQQPIHYWVPSIAPCGMTFVTSDYYPEWQGDLLIGSLKFLYLHRAQLSGEEVIYEEKLFPEIGRVRNVQQSPVDGFIYVGIEGKGLYKIVKTDND